MIDEGYLSTALHDLADHGQPTDPPVQRVFHRGRRRRARRLAGGTAIVAAAAMVATAITLVPHGERGPGSLQLAADVTAESTYRFSGTDTVRVDGAKEPSHNHFISDARSGAYDPIHRRGFFTVTPSASDTGGDLPAVWEERAIGDACYTRYSGEPRWEKLLRPCHWITDDTWGGTRWARPMDLLDSLRRGGSATYQGRVGHGAGAVDRWTFNYSEPADPRAESGPIPVSGTVDVAVATGRITTVTCQRVTEWLSETLGGRPLRNTQQSTIRFSDYGAPVTVSAPVAYDVVPEPVMPAD